MTLKQKHKVLRKVKEHHKKKAKDAKKLGLNRKPRVEKDPGIPNDWPFKEQELKALEVRRARAVEEIEQKKIARKERVSSSFLNLYDTFFWYLVKAIVFDAENYLYVFGFSLIDKEISYSPCIAVVSMK